MRIGSLLVGRSPASKSTSIVDPLLSINDLKFIITVLLVVWLALMILLEWLAFISPVLLFRSSLIIAAFIIELLVVMWLATSEMMTRSNRKRILFKVHGLEGAL
jgi:hypothetical protein